MKRFKLSLEAGRDIREIWEYIVPDSVRAARKVRLMLLDACQLQAEHRKIGHRREDLTDEQVLFWPVGSYLIVYVPDTRPLELVRVISGARDVRPLL